MGYILQYVLPCDYLLFFFWSVSVRGITFSWPGQRIRRPASKTVITSRFFNLCPETSFPLLGWPITHGYLRPGAFSLVECQRSVRLAWNAKFFRTFHIFWFNVVHYMNSKSSCHANLSKGIVPLNFKFYREYINEKLESPLGLCRPLRCEECRWPIKTELCTSGTLWLATWAACRCPQDIIAQVSRKGGHPSFVLLLGYTYTWIKTFPRNTKIMNYHQLKTFEDKNANDSNFYISATNIKNIWIKYQCFMRERRGDSDRGGEFLPGQECGYC